MRRLLRCVLAAVTLWGLIAQLAPSAHANEQQITDPAGDFPLGFADLTGVKLSIQTLKGKEYLDVTFVVVDPITDESRAAMTGYVFEAKVGACELTMSVNAYPSALTPAGFTIGSPHAECAGSDTDVPGGYSYKDNTVRVIVGLGDLPQVVRGATLTNLRAHTAMLQGTANTNGAVGDQATASKPWTIA